jgi:hypothetical protein
MRADRRAAGLVIQAAGCVILTQVPVTSGLLIAEIGLVVLFIGQSPILQPPSGHCQDRKEWRVDPTEQGRLSTLRSCAEAGP